MVKVKEEEEEKEPEGEKIELSPGDGQEDETPDPEAQSKAALEALDEDADNEESSLEKERLEDGLVDQELSAFERMMKRVPSEDRGVVLERYIGSLTEEERADLPWTKRDRDLADEVRQRGEENRATAQAAQFENLAKQDADQALRAITEHLTVAQKGAFAGDAESGQIDSDLLNREINRYATAQSRLQNRQLVRTIGMTILTEISSVGDPLTNAELREIVQKSGGTQEGIISGYVQKYGRMMKAAGAKEAKTNLDEDNNVWRKTELAVMHAQVMAGEDIDLEPASPTDRAALEELEVADPPAGVNGAKLTTEDSIKVSLKKDRKRKRSRV